MRREDVENFIKEYDLPKCFGITTDDDGEYVVIYIDNAESGFYRLNNRYAIMLLDDSFMDIIEPLYAGMCDCIIFNYGDVILSKEDTWDGWQADFVIENFYNADTYPFD